MPRIAVILATAAALVGSPVAASTAAVSVATTGAAQQTGIPLNYCAFTIDSADMYYGANWTSTQLINLVKQLSLPASPTLIRLGGSATNDWSYVGAAGYSTDGTHTKMNNSVFDAVNSFIAASNSQLIFNLRLHKNAKGDFNPALNATPLFAYTAAAKYAVPPVGWEIGNEIASGNATQYGNDMRILKTALTAFPSIGQSVVGPSLCCGTTPAWARSYMQAAGSVLDALTVHSYPLNACNDATFLNIGEMESSLQYVASYAVERDAVAPGEYGWQCHAR